MNRYFLISFITFSIAWANTAKPAPKPVAKGPAKTQTAPAKAAPTACTPAGVAPPTTGPGYSDPALCCPGNIIIVQMSACERAYGGFAGICAPCGNNKCDTDWEDKCNCPEDCSLMAAPPVPKK